MVVVYVPVSYVHYNDPVPRLHQAAVPGHRDTGQQVVPGDHHHLQLSCLQLPTGNQSSNLSLDRLINQFIIFDQSINQSII